MEAYAVTERSNIPALFAVVRERDYDGTW